MEERVYTINLRRGILNSPRWKKSDDAVGFVRRFVSKHMKSGEVSIDNSISMKIWEHGNQNPTGKIRIKVVKDDDGKVTARLFDSAPLEPEMKEEKTEEKIEEKPKEEVKQAKEEKKGQPEKKQ